jgi:hypothetical protein
MVCSDAAMLEIDTKLERAPKPDPHLMVRLDRFSSCVTGVLRLGCHQNDRPGLLFKRCILIHTHRPPDFLEPPPLTNFAFGVKSRTQTKPQSRTGFSEVAAPDAMKVRKKNLCHTCRKRKLQVSPCISLL